MKTKVDELKAVIDKYETLMEEKDELLKEKEWYQGEYEKIRYSLSYRSMRRAKKMMVKVGAYQALKALLNQMRKIRNNYSIQTDKLAGYNHFRFKCNRKESYSFDPNTIEHNYVKKLVSIVLPVYNGGELFDKTVKSILSQSYTNFELIIVNDGSTDGTLKKAKNYAKKDSRIIIIDQPNQKLPVAISNGFRKAHGEYYMWVGADDILHKYCIELLIKELKSDVTVDYVFPNVRLIDEYDEPIKNNKWYNSDKEHPENVMLPHEMYNLNVVKNNYIAPIAMYKSIVVKTLEDFSANRFTVEDYEYWMKINNIFNMKHVSFDKPIFDYRRHSLSLTSKAKELNIADKTRNLMLFEDFRRDYLMTPLIWVIDVENENNPLYVKLVDSIKKAGHLILTREEAFKDCYSNIYKNQVYLYMGDDITAIDKKVKSIPSNIYKVLLTNNCDNKSDIFDLYLTSSNVKITNLGDYKGWFRIKDAQNVFSFIDIKIKHTYLRVMENIIENKEDDSSKKLSIVICTYKRSEKLNNAIKSAINQTASKKDYEIIIINNDINTTEIFEIVNKFRKEYDLSSRFLRYYEAPIKGLSFARNVGLFVSRGSRILYLDDDSIAFEDLVEQMIKAYDENSNAGVIGGQIILKTPKKIPDIFVKENAAYWSQFLIAGNNYQKVKEWYQFPYGANFSVDRKSLLKIGGFRTGYGRVGHNFVGGEEVVVSLLIRKLDRDVVLAPNAKVYHDVDESRYTINHIEKTDLCSAYTRLKMEMDLYKPTYYLIKRNSKRELAYLQAKLKKTKNAKERLYIVSNIKAYKVALNELRNIAKDMRKMK